MEAWEVFRAVVVTGAKSLAFGFETLHRPPGEIRAEPPFMRLKGRVERLFPDMIVSQGAGYSPSSLDRMMRMTSDVPSTICNTFAPL